MKSKILVLLLAVSLLTACGSSGESQEKAPAEKSTAVETEQAKETPAAEEKSSGSAADEYKASFLSFVDENSGQNFSNYQKSEKAYNFISANPGMFPSSSDVYGPHLNPDLEFKHVTKDITAVGEEFMAIDGTVLSIYANPTESEGVEKVTELEIVDSSFNYYNLVYFGELPDIYSEDTVHAVFLPYALISFPNQAGGSTVGILSYAAEVTKIQ